MLTTAWHRCQRLVEQRLQPAHLARPAALSHATHPFVTARHTTAAGAAVPMLPCLGEAVGGSESGEAAVAAVGSGDGGGGGGRWRGDEGDAHVRRNAVRLMEASDGLLSFARARLPPLGNQGEQVAERRALLLNDHLVLRWLVASAFLTPCTGRLLGTALAWQGEWNRASALGEGFLRGGCMDLGLGCGVSRM